MIARLDHCVGKGDTKEGCVPSEPELKLQSRVLSTGCERAGLSAKCLTSTVASFPRRRQAGAADGAVFWKSKELASIRCSAINSCMTFAILGLSFLICEMRREKFSTLPIATQFYRRNYLLLKQHRRSFWRIKNVNSLSSLRI